MAPAITFDQQFERAQSAYLADRNGKFAVELWRQLQDLVAVRRVKTKDNKVREEMLDHTVETGRECYLKFLVDSLADAGPPSNYTIHLANAIHTVVENDQSLLNAHLFRLLNERRHLANSFQTSSGNAEGKEIVGVLRLKLNLLDPALQGPIKDSYVAIVSELEKKVDQLSDEERLRNRQRLLNQYVEGQPEGSVDSDDD